MNRRPAFRSLAVAAESSTSAAASAAMPSHPYFKLWHPQGRRGYSNRPAAPATGDQPEFVSGDSHFRAVREANLSCRPSYNAVPPSPQYFAAQHYSRPRPQSQPPGNRSFRGPRPLGPAVGNHQRFGAQQRQQQVRPRSSKPPDYRDWEYAKPGPPPHWERFAILSYNVLADYLAADHWEKLYIHIPPHIMDWNSRKRSLTFELGLWSADILCLQEVDRFQDLATELKPRGYNGIWKMRTGDPVDGCAIFWRVSRFKLLHEESIEYNKLGLRDNVAQICVFESLNRQRNTDGASTPSSSNRVVVCNIHVLFNPKRGDIKLGQTILWEFVLAAKAACKSYFAQFPTQIRVLLDKANTVSKLWDDAPIVICGDFNCTPKSSLYNFISEQKLDLSEVPRDRVSGQVSAEIRPSRPAYSYFRAEPANHTAQAGAEVEGCLPSDAQKLASTNDFTNGSSTGNNFEPGSPLVDETSLPCGGESLSCGRTNDMSSNDAPDSYAVRNTVEVTVLESSSSYRLVPQESNDADFFLDERFESRSLVVEANDELQEDCDSFISELHGTIQGPFSADSDSRSDNQKLRAKGHEIHRGIPYAYNDFSIDEGKTTFSSAAWTPMEIETATGSADSNVMEHPLKLTSAYAEVESSSGSRDSDGEPFVTSYHRRFLGTVDYIWVSEGLQPAKVLAPIPKHVMQHTRGFPTKKWGSDHIALVSELAFTKDLSSENAS